MDSTSSIFAMIPRTPTVRRTTISAVLFRTTTEGCGLGCMATGWIISTGGTLPISLRILANPAGLHDGGCFRCCSIHTACCGWQRPVGGWCGSTPIRGSSPPISWTRPSPATRSRTGRRTSIPTATAIWVASPTSGLFRFDPETGKFTRHYTEKDGLANNAVVGILGDDARQPVGQHGQGIVQIRSQNGDLPQLRCVRRPPRQ